MDFKYYNSAFANIQLLRVVPGNAKAATTARGRRGCGVIAFAKSAV